MCYRCIADDDYPDDGAAGDAGSEEGEVANDSGWGDSATSPQLSQQTQAGGSAMQTSDHAQVNSEALQVLLKFWAWCITTSALQQHY